MYRTVSVQFEFIISPYKTNIYKQLKISDMKVFIAKKKTNRFVLLKFEYVYQPMLFGHSSVTGIKFEHFSTNSYFAKFRSAISVLNVKKRNTV